MQVKLWDPLRTRAVPERFRGVFATRRYTNPRLPLPYLTKFVFDRGSARTPLGELSALPRPPSWIKGALLLRKGECRVEEIEGKGGFLKIVIERSQMAKVPNGVETLRKISIAWVGCTNVTDDRRQTDGRAMSSRSLKIIITLQYKGQQQQQ